MKHLKNFKLFETGEPDIDYTDVNMDKIVELLEEEGYDASYREFDKYQGVYLTIRKNGKSSKLWWTDTHHIDEWGDGAISSVLIDEDGAEWSGGAGDYWNLPKDHVFQGSKLIYKMRKDGKVETKEIDDPKVSDFPEMIGTKGTFTPEKEEMEFTLTPEKEEMEFTLDGSEDTIATYVVGSNDISDILSII